MQKDPILSRAAETYLCRYREILRRMIDEMTSVEPSDSISRDFILQMIPHHRAAIEMSENLLCYTTCLPLERIADDIIAEQTESIADLEESLDACSACRSDRESLCLYWQQYRRVTEEMFEKMGNAPKRNNLNLDFLREMLPHHEGALGLCRNALRFPLCPQLYPIIDSILTSQSRGIRQMRQLLTVLSR